MLPADWVPRYRYYMAAAARVGVPQMWVEDAASDIAIKCWHDQKDDAITVRSAAIDAARHYGKSRAGYDRNTMAMPYANDTSDPYAVVDLWLDRVPIVLAVLRTATPYQRACFRRAMRGTTKRDYAAYTHAMNLRKRMRAAA